MKSGYVVIAGRPNAGKSTLINQVLGARLSIVTPKAQTTRERVLGILSEPDLGQIVFIDTPGIHKAKEGGINEFMVSEAKLGLDGAEVVWYIVDPESLPKHEEAVLDLLKGIEEPIFLLINKCDILNSAGRRNSLIALREGLAIAAQVRKIQFAQTFEISARYDQGIQELLKCTWDLLKEGPVFYPDLEQMSDRPLRFFVAEKIREQLFLQLGDEVPYCCAVEIVRFDEAVNPPRIEATIHVERESQKGIVIGKGAEKIKAIGQSARAEIEKFLGSQVFLGLKVEFLKDWSKDAEKLKRLGYHLPEGKAQ